MRLFWGLLLILFIECDDPVGIAVLDTVEGKLGQAGLFVNDSHLFLCPRRASVVRLTLLYIWRFSIKSYPLTRSRERPGDFGCGWTDSLR